MALDRLSATRYLILGATALTLLVAGFGTWAMFAQISGAIVVSGRIEVERNRQVVQHPDGGVVAQVLVDEGDRVEAGAPLITLDDSQLRPQITILESQLFELMARRGRLESEQDDLNEVNFDPELLRGAASRDPIRELVAGQRRLFAARRAALDQVAAQRVKRKEQIAKQIEGLAAQQRAVQRQLQLVAHDLETQQALLAKGLAQSARLLGLRREEARLIGQLGELRAAVAQAEGRIIEIDMEITGLRVNRREEAIATLRDLRVREVEVAEKVGALIAQQNRLIIRAPVSGSVHALSVFAEKSVIRAAEPLVYIVPQDHPLVIIAQIDPIDIDQVHIGQGVLLRFSTLDQKSTPELSGTIRKVSADIFRDEAGQRAFYRAEIVVGETELALLPDGVAAIPGMPVEGFVKTGDRTPLAYLTRPFTDYFMRAFRES